jgi:hypothetical protein
MLHHSKNKAQQAIPLREPLAIYLLLRITAPGE